MLDALNNVLPKTTRVAAYSLVWDSNRLLLCRLAVTTSHPGMWTLPGGGLEFGEQPADGMIREVLEETGLEVRPAGIVGVDLLTRENPDELFQSVRIIYSAKVIGGHLRHELSGSTDMCQWIPATELNSLQTVGLVTDALSMQKASGV